MYVCTFVYLNTRQIWLQVYMCVVNFQFELNSNLDQAGAIKCEKERNRKNRLLLLFQSQTELWLNFRTNLETAKGKQDSADPTNGLWGAHNCILCKFT